MVQFDSVRACDHLCWSGSHFRDDLAALSQLAVLVSTESAAWQMRLSMVPT